MHTEKNSNLDAATDMNKKHKQNPKVNQKEASETTKVTDEGLDISEETKEKSSKKECEAGSREELEKIIEEQKEKISELNDKYLRSLADRDNLLKRTQKEKEAIAKYGLEGFMLDFLPVLDSLAKVESSFGENRQGEDVSSYKEGFLLLKQQILKVLEKHGVTPFDSVGEKFDPNRHQAMSKLEVEGIKEETVKEEYLKGYMINGKLLRASFVVVQVPKSK